MPEHARGDRAPGAPRARDAGNAVRVRERSHAFHLPHRRDEREIAARPDIGTA